MNNFMFLSLETSLELEKYGFPVPDMQAGQLWYHKLNKQKMVSTGNSPLPGSVEWYVYAPRAEEILFELYQFKYGIMMNGHTFILTQMDSPEVGEYEDVDMDVNIHELVARAWIKRIGKK